MNFTTASNKILIGLYFYLPLLALVLAFWALFFASEGSFAISIAVMCCAGISLSTLATVSEILTYSNKRPH